MSLYYILVVFLVIAIAFFLVWKYCPQPPKIVLLWALSIGMVLWVLNILGFWDWLRTATI